MLRRLIAMQLQLDSALASSSPIEAANVLTANMRLCSSVVIDPALLLESAEQVVSYCCVYAVSSARSGKHAVAYDLLSVANGVMGPRQGVEASRCLIA